MKKRIQGSIVLFLIFLAVWFINKDLAFFLLVLFVITLFVDGEDIRERLGRVIYVLENREIAEWWEFLPDKTSRETFKEAEELSRPKPANKDKKTYTLEEKLKVVDDAFEKTNTSPQTKKFLKLLIAKGSQQKKEQEAEKENV